MEMQNQGAIPPDYSIRSEKLCFLSFVLGRVCMRFCLLSPAPWSTRPMLRAWSACNWQTSNIGHKRLSCRPTKEGEEDIRIYLLRGIRSVQGGWEKVQTWASMTIKLIALRCGEAAFCANNKNAEWTDPIRNRLQFAVSVFWRAVKEKRLHNWDCSPSASFFSILKTSVTTCVLWLTSESRKFLFLKFYKIFLKSSVKILFKPWDSLTSQQSYLQWYTPCSWRAEKILYPKISAVCPPYAYEKGLFALASSIINWNKLINDSRVSPI